MLNITRLGRSIAIRQRIQRIKLVARSVASEKLDAIDVLELDHLRIHKLFRQLWLARSLKEQHSVFNLLRDEFLRHASLEEASFYPIAQKNDVLRGIIDRSFEEHSVAKGVIAEIDAMYAGFEDVKPSKSVLSEFTRKLDARLEVLYENIERHVLNEERRVFPVIRASTSRSELVGLGSRFEAARTAVPPTNGKAAPRLRKQRRRQQIAASAQATSAEAPQPTASSGTAA